MAKCHILLLPRMDYYKWVRAAQKYALHFGIGIVRTQIGVGGKISPHPTATHSRAISCCGSRPAILAYWSI